MNYLELLPLNIHQEIVNQVHIIEQPFEATMENEKIILTRKYDLDNTLNKMSSYFLDKQFEEKLEIYFNKVHLIDNIFITQYRYPTLKSFFFKGDHKLYLFTPDGFRILSLTNKTNKDIFQALINKSVCDICIKPLNFKIENNQIVSTDLCFPDETRCGSKTKFQIECSNFLKFIHPSCATKCISCDKYLCKKHIKACLKCNKILCGSSKCSCRIGCYNCNTLFCKYTDEMLVDKGGNKYCNNCLTKCDECTKFFRNLNIFKCNKCSKAFCGSCKQKNMKNTQLLYGRASKQYRCFNCKIISYDL